MLVNVAPHGLVDIAAASLQSPSTNVSFDWASSANKFVSLHCCKCGIGTLGVPGWGLISSHECRRLQPPDTKRLSRGKLICRCSPSLQCDLRMRATVLTAAAENDAEQVLSCLTQWSTLSFDLS